MIECQHKCPRRPLTRYELSLFLKRAAEIEKFNLTPKELTSSLNIARNESNYNPLARNRNSSAYGLFQFLDRTWATTGVRKTDCVLHQCIAFIRYCIGKYKTPSRAWNKWTKRKGY